MNKFVPDSFQMQKRVKQRKRDVACKITDEFIKTNENSEKLSNACKT